MTTRIQPLTAWLDYCSDSASGFILGRLHSYAILRPQARKIAQHGLAEVFKQAERRSLRLAKIRHDDAMDGHKAERWLRYYGYHEALRIVLDVPEVRTLFELLDPKQQRLLQWRYVDQASDEAVATMFEIYNRRGEANTAEARRQSWEGYHRLCAAIREQRKKQDSGLSEWDLQYVFPLFPGLCREHQPQSL